MVLCLGQKYPGLVVVPVAVPVWGFWVQVFGSVGRRMKILSWIVHMMEGLGKLGWKVLDNLIMDNLSGIHLPRWHLRCTGLLQCNGYYMCSMAAPALTKWDRSQDLLLRSRKAADNVAEVVAVGSCGRTPRLALRSRFVD